MNVLEALVSMGTSIVNTGVAIVGLVLAVFGAVTGFRAWRRELRGTTQYQVARKLLRTAYRFEGTIAATRSPAFIDVDVMPHLPNRSESEHAAAALRLSDALRKDYNVRLRRLVDAEAALRLAERDAKVIFGSDASKAVESLHNIAMKLWTTVGTYFSSERGRIQSGSRRSEIPGLIEEHRILFSLPPNDTLSDELKKAMQEVEEFCRKHLK
jgi:hypothetical protein